MTLPDKLTVADAFLNILGSNDVYNNYQKAKEELLQYTTSSNTTAVSQPWWKQSTTSAAPKPYGYDAEDCYKWPNAYKQPRTTDNTDIQDDCEKSLPWLGEDSEEDKAERVKRQEEVRRLIEEIRRQQQINAEEQDRLRRAQEQRQIEAMRENHPVQPVEAAKPVTVPQPQPTTPTEVPAIEDELRPLRFSPLVTPKQ